MKISQGQLLTLLFLSRIFTTITYFSLEPISLPTIIVTVIVSVAVDMILVIPAILIYKKYPDENIVRAAFKINKVLGYIIFAVYFAAVVYIVFRTVRFFLFFFKSTFPDLLPVVVVGALIMIAAIYAAYLGMEAVARSAAVVLGLFVIMLVLVIGFTVSDFEMINYYTQPISADSFMSGVLSGISRSSEIVLLLLSLPYLRKGIVGSVYGFLALKLVVIEAVLISCMLLLGSYVETTKFPFFTMCTYAKSSFIERLDAVFLVVWTLMGIVRLAFAAASVKPAVEAFAKKDHKYFYAAAPILIGGIPALYCAYKDKMIFSFLDKDVAVYIVAVLGFLIPLILYFIRRSIRRKER